MAFRTKRAASLVALAFSVVVVGLPAAVGAQEGDPIEIGDNPETTGIATPPPLPQERAQADGEVTAQATYRFGQTPLNAVIDAATSASSKAPCGISTGGLAALMLAPTFLETGAGTSAAPSPMTLSRYDTDVGLHSLSDKSRYSRAFWHPGIGLWQFDGIGGWAKSASERIRVDQIAPLAARVMVERYCASIVDGASATAARSAAWRPWVACRKGGCESIFQAVYPSGDSFGLTLDPEVTIGGGTTTASCRIPGDGTLRPCVRIDPTKAEGYYGWARPGFGPAPISFPFHVLEVGGNEWRIWNDSDTGYGVNVAASKPLAANPRAVVNPAKSCELVSPIVWYVDSVKQSSTVSTCDPTPPPNFRRDDVAIGGTYQPLVGDFTGDQLDDVFWYAPGPGPDYLWRSPVPSGASVPVSVGGIYEPLVGDFTGDGLDDIFWYSPGSGSEYLWRATGRSSAPFVSERGPTVNGIYQARVGDFDGNGADDITWFAAGSAADYVWFHSPDSGVRSVAVSLSFAQIPVIGDLDGDGRDDLLGYSPGGGRDAYLFGGSSGFVSRSISIGGTYEVSSGDFDGDGRDDLYFHVPSNGAGYLWWSGSRPAAGAAPNSVSMQAPPRSTAVLLDSADRTEILWFAKGTSSDSFWRFSGRTLQADPSPMITAPYQTIVGRFASKGDEVIWYLPGPSEDAFWVRR